jgi:hypothetical protein
MSVASPVSADQVHRHPLQFQRHAAHQLGHLGCDRHAGQRLQAAQ